MSWKLDRVGDPTADVICPHGRPVDFINLLDYDFAYDDPKQQRTNQNTITKWLIEHKDNLIDLCLGHDQGAHR